MNQYGYVFKANGEVFLTKLVDGFFTDGEAITNTEPYNDMPESTIALVKVEDFLIYKVRQGFTITDVRWIDLFRDDEVAIAADFFSDPEAVNGLVKFTENLAEEIEKSELFEDDEHGCS